MAPGGMDGMDEMDFMDAMDPGRAQGTAWALELGDSAQPSAHL